MASEEENPKPNQDADNRAPEGTPPAPKDTFPPEMALPPRHRKKEKKSSGMGGILFLVALIIVGGAGAGGFYLYQEQIKFQNEILARISQLETQLSALDTEAELTRNNQQSIGTLNQELQQHKKDISATLQAHQNSLTTLDEDVLRLKDKVEKNTPAAPSVTSPMAGELEAKPGLLIEPLPETRDGDAPDFKSEGDQDDEESQKFLDWMENFFSSIWNWFAGLFK